MSALSIQVKDLKQELAVAQEAHVEQVAAFESQIAELAEAKEGFEAKVAELDKALVEANESAEAIKAEAEELKAGLMAKEEELAVAKSEIEQAKAALADPSLAPVAEAGAEDDGQSPLAEEPASLEKLRSLEGSERAAYWAEHKSELLKL